MYKTFTQSAKITFKKWKERVKSPADHTPLGIISCWVYPKLSPFILKKGKLVINQSYLFFYLNSVRKVVLENMYVWNFFILFVLKNEIFCPKDYKVYHYGTTFRFWVANSKRYCFYCYVYISITHSQKIWHWCPKLFYMCTFPEQMWKSFYLHTAKLAQG